MKDKFLGRILDTDTMTYKHKDCSGVDVPEELRQQVYCDLENRNSLGGNALLPIGRIMAFKDNK